jgi:CBS domain-containing protein
VTAPTGDPQSSAFWAGRSCARLDFGPNPRESRRNSRPRFARRSRTTSNMRHNGAQWGLTMTIQKLMDGKGRFVSVIRSDVRVDDVINQLEADDVSALIVSDDKDKILGIISGQDIVRALKAFGRNVGDKPVGELMTRDVITCEIGEPLNKIYELMDKHQIRHVPITKNGHLCGIINILDVIKFRLDELNREAEALREYVAGRA